MGNGEPGKRRPRRPTLRSALAAAKATGRTVKNATIDPDGKIRIEFGEIDEPEPGQSDKPADQDWDKRMREVRERREKKDRSKRT
jgi:hypothetical protein